MRRGISILLAFIFGVGPLSAALPGAEDAKLPVCCRRHGAHHCAMAARMAAMMAAAEAGKTVVTAPSTCPNYPGPIFALLAPAHALTATAFESAERSPETQPTLLPDPAIQSSAIRTHAGRGPPVLLAS